MTEQPIAAEIAAADEFADECQGLSVDDTLYDYGGKAEFCKKQDVGNLARCYLASREEVERLIKAYASLFTKHTMYISEKIDAASADATLKAALDASTKDYCDALDRAADLERDRDALREALEEMLNALAMGPLEPDEAIVDAAHKACKALAPSPQSSDCSCDAEVRWLDPRCPIHGEPSREIEGDITISQEDLDTLRNDYGIE